MCNMLMYYDIAYLALRNWLPWSYSFYTRFISFSDRCWSCAFCVNSACSVHEAAYSSVANAAASEILSSWDALRPESFSATRCYPHLSVTEVTPQLVSLPASQAQAGRNSKNVWQETAFEIYTVWFWQKCRFVLFGEAFVVSDLASTGVVQPGLEWDPTPWQKTRACDSDTMTTMTSKLWAMVVNCESDFGHRIEPTII